MQCPRCQTQLQTIEYESIRIETCPGCEGEWLDGGELKKIVDRREEQFNDDEKRALGEAEPVRGIPSEEAGHELTCPGCGEALKPINYGGGTGIIIDRCGACNGIWVDEGELEKVQMVVEQWRDGLEADREKYSPMLRRVAQEVDERDNVQISRLPLVGRYVNMLINGVIDITR